MRINVGLLTCLATLTFCGTSLASTTETPAQKTEAIQLACLRRLIIASADYKHLNPGPLIFVTIDRGNSTDPAANVLNALLQTNKNIRPMSKGASSTGGVREKGSKLTGLRVWVDSNFKSTDTQAIVTGGVFTNGKAAQDVRLYLKRDKDNTWRVANACILEVS